MVILCGHPLHPVELVTSVALMGSAGGVALWFWCKVTTLWKQWRGDDA